MEEGMATLSSNLAWIIPWTEEPGGLRSTGSQRVKYYWSTPAHNSTALCWLSRQTHNSTAGTQLNSVKIFKCVPTILLLRIYSKEIVRQRQKIYTYMDVHPNATKVVKMWREDICKHIGMTCLYNKIPQPLKRLNILQQMSTIYCCGQKIYNSSIIF